MQFGVIDRCPAPKRLLPVLQVIKAETGLTFNSIDRSREAEPILKRYGKQSQAQLYYGWVHRLPGYNPANPPGFSTHERRNDGVAYAWPPRGAPLPYWAVGLDVDDAHVHAAGDVAAKHGWVLTRTYPTSVLEYHHLNFRRMPRYFRTIVRGMRGPRVVWIQWVLRYLGDDVHKPMKRGVYDDATVANVKIVQKHWGLRQDGVYGPRTSTVFHRAVRHHRQLLKEKR